MTSKILIVRCDMTKEQYLKNLNVPSGRVDVILDTDAYNEIDDQFAISYLLLSGEKLNTVGLCAAPFFNSLSAGAKDGMEKSYNEILKLLTFLGRDDLKEKTFRGSEQYLPDEKTPVISDAARFIVESAKKYTPEEPLYVVAIGAITNVASAILLDPIAKENTVIVWLGGHAMGCDWARGEASEFNMVQDIAGARVLYKSKTPLVMLPCEGVVSAFTLSGAELDYWLKGTNPLGDYLTEHTTEAAEKYAKGTAWTRVIWDVTAVAWLLNDEKSPFIKSRIIKAMLPEYDKSYSYPEDAKEIVYVTKIKRDTLMTDLLEKIRNFGK